MNEKVLREILYKMQFQTFGGIYSNHTWELIQRYAKGEGFDVLDKQALKELSSLFANYILPEYLKETNQNIPNIFKMALRSK